MAEFKVTQVKSKIGGNSKQRNTLRSLGLHRIGETVVKPDRPEFRGMVHAVRHLVTSLGALGTAAGRLALGAFAAAEPLLRLVGTGGRP